MNALRIVRWTLACLIVFTSWAFVFGVGIVSAENGTIIVQKNFYLPYNATGGGGPVTPNLAVLSVDYTTFAQPLQLSVQSGDFVFVNASGSTRFTATAGTAVCSGTFAYVASSKVLTWFFDDVATCLPSTNLITITYVNDLAPQITLDTAGPWGAISAATPMGITYGGGGTAIARAGAGKKPWNYTATGVSTTHTAYNVTYLPSNLFLAMIDKLGETLTRNVTVHGSGGVIYCEDGGYTASNSNCTAAQTNGIFINVSLPSGEFNDVLVNATNSGVVAPAVITINPLTGVGITFDAASYTIGGTANISWIRTNSTPFGFQDDIYLTQPGNIKKILLSSPPDIGFIKTNDLPVAGEYKVTFERSILSFSPEILASDTANITAEQASFIIVNNSVPVGVYTQGNYSAGWTGTGRIVIYQDNVSTGPKEIDSLAITGVCCVENTVSQLFFPEPGNYRVVLMKGYDTVKDTASVTAYYQDIFTPMNITVSNISLNKDQYTYGEPYTITFQVDSFNYSTKAKRIIAYEIATGANTLISPVPAQTGTITRTFDSEAYPFSGALQLRLMGLNSTGDYLLAYVNFTLSKIDTEGYGLDVTKSPICTRETGYFTYYSPSPVTVTIQDRDVSVYVKNLTTAISGKTVPFSISRAGNYEIFLRPSNETDVKFTKIIEVKTCDVAATQPPISGTQQAQQVATMITTPIFWALIVTAGLMIAIAWKTRDGFAAGSVGMLSAGVFSYMAWLPLWIFFSVLIVAALLLASSLVAKQLEKTG